MSGISQCLNIEDLRDLARRRLPRAVFDYMDGGAETEVTSRRNVSAFDSESIVPRFLVDVSRVNTATRVFGKTVEWPLVCSPTGASRSYHPDGELAVARAAGDAGVIYGLSMMANHSLEHVAAVSTGPKLFQLYLFRDRDFTWQLIERCRRFGYQALCITVDAPVRGKRERELRSGVGVGRYWLARNITGFVRHPWWSLKQAWRGPISMPNLASEASGRALHRQAEYANQQLDSSITWKDIRDIVDYWKGPVAIKGIMAVEDARAAVGAGASAVIVSNHGGRQLDGAAAAFEVLPQIAQAVGDQIDVLLDGGIRRGVHVLKALATGAKACCVGRPYLYGLGAGGEAGVAKAIEILQSELVRAMQLAGCVDVNHIDRKLLRRLDMHCSSATPP